MDTYIFTNNMYNTTIYNLSRKVLFKTYKFIAILFAYYSENNKT